MGRKRMGRFPGPPGGLGFGHGSRRSASAQLLPLNYLAADPESRHNLTMSDEPFGYGDRWWDRMARRRRIGTLIAGLGIILGMLVGIIR